MNSFWLENINKIEGSGILENDTNADVCIIGAGICGLTTAYYLCKEGYRVIVIDKENIANGVTGHTTAKITSQHGLIYSYLSKEYGINFAKKYYEANEQAIKNIEEIIQKNSIECDFEKKNSYIYTEKEEELDKIKEEIEALKNISHLENFKAENIDLPFKTLGGVEFKNQAEFNPLKYIKGLVKYILNKKGRIYENTLCIDVKKENEEFTIFTETNKIYAKCVVIATQYPFIKIPGLYFLKMYQASSYVIGVQTNEKLPEGMYINVEEPKLSFRTAIDKEKNKILLIGGAGHKTGKKITYEETYEILEKRAKELYEDAKIKYKWSTRDAITLDKIPYIGELSSIYENMYVATGFNKWGMTSSNVAANIIVEKIKGNGSIYDEIFKARRFKPIENKGEVKNMIVDSVKGIIGDRIKSEKIEIDEIKNNSGGIVDIDGEKVGIYKNEEGKIYKIDPVCTHLGCILEWNDVDKTWDCPCHGSRFDKYGKNIYGPAIKNIKEKI